MQFDVKEYAVSSKTKKNHELTENPVQLLDNPPAAAPWHPALQAAMAGALGAGVDALVQRFVDPGMTGLLVSAAAKGALGWWAQVHQSEETGSTPWEHAGSALVGAATYQGTSYAIARFFPPQPASEPAPNPAPAANGNGASGGGQSEAGGYVMHQPPGYQYVPGIGYVPIEQLWAYAQASA